SLEPIDARADNRFRRVEVRLTDLQMDDAAALTLQFRGPPQHLESGLPVHTQHPFCNPAFRIQLQSVNSLSKEMTSKYNISLSMLEGRVADKWIHVATLSELPTEGLGHAVKADGLDIALFRWDDRIYAIEDLCPHLGFPLSEGVMQSGEIICSWH